jgi:hypothetical protein
VPAVPVFRGDVVMMESAVGFVISENDFVAVCDGDPLSVTCTVKVAVPGVVGVPLITPALDSVRPCGKIPEESDQVYGAVPFAGASVCEYAVPSVASGRDVVVIKSPAAMLSTNGLETVCGGVPLSATCTVTFDVPALVGVPLITPALDRVTPAGSVPDVTVQLYGVVPPPAAKV